MLTPDKNFKMWSSTKTALASHGFKNAHERGAFKRMMIDAQLSYEAAKRAALKAKEGKKEFGGTSNRGNHAGVASVDVE